MIKLAILDLYAGEKNLGMHHIKKIIGQFDEIEATVFDVRGAFELPSLDFDIYVSSGGPGSPLEGKGVWIRAFYHLMDRLWSHNQRNEDKKHIFFICHSFQMICNHLSLGSVVKRRKPSFGVFPVHMTPEGREDEVFQNLEDPFTVADFRHWQFVKPNKKRMKALNCTILALEKPRKHVPLERAVMAMRFSPEWVGVQFHPEADPQGMHKHFSDPERKAKIKDKKGEKKYIKMMNDINNPSGLENTFKNILPNFLKDSIRKLERQQSLLLM